MLSGASIVRRIAPTEVGAVSHICTRTKIQFDGGSASKTARALLTTPPLPAQHSHRVGDRMLHCHGARCRKSNIDMKGMQADARTPEKRARAFSRTAAQSPAREGRRGQQLRGCGFGSRRSGSGRWGGSHECGRIGRAGDGEASSNCCGRWEAALPAFPADASRTGARRGDMVVGGRRHGHGGRGGEIWRWAWQRQRLHLRRLRSHPVHRELAGQPTVPARARPLPAHRRLRRRRWCAREFQGSHAHAPARRPGGRHGGGRGGGGGRRRRRRRRRLGQVWPQTCRCWCRRDRAQARPRHTTPHHTSPRHATPRQGKGFPG